VVSEPRDGPTRGAIRAICPIFESHPTVDTWHLIILLSSLTKKSIRSLLLVRRESGQSNPRRQQGRGGIQEGPHNPGSLHSNQSHAPRLVKLDFPHFNGREDPTSWICRAKQFFRFHDTPIADQVELASFHLEGEA